MAVAKRTYDHYVNALPLSLIPDHHYYVRTSNTTADYYIGDRNGNPIRIGSVPTTGVNDLDDVPDSATRLAVSPAEKATWNGKQDAGDYATNTALTTGLSNKVDKVTGKGLSTEDYTTQEKSDLAALKAIVGEGVTDGDSIVNTLSELLAVFQNYSEGVDVATQIGLGVTAHGWGDHASAGYITGINSGDVTTALGYTPINPNGTSSQYFLGNGTLATIISNNNQLTNGAGYITSAALSPYLTSADATSTYQPIGNYATAAAGKTGLFSNTLTLAGTDDSTLNIGTGGTLGTASFVADNTLVHLAGTETISGEKTLSSLVNIQNGKIAMPNDAVIIGNGAGNNKIAYGSDTNEVFIGYGSGNLVQTGLTFHTFVGAMTGSNAAAGSGGVAVGQKALNVATTIQSSTAIGGKALSNMINAQSDVAVGYGAMQFATSTNLGRRTALGYNASQYDNGDYNISIGYTSGSQVQTGSPAGNPTTGSNNIAVGQSSMNALNGGQRNIGIGTEALKAVTNGNSNVAAGYQTLLTLTGGINNVCIGDGAGTTHTGSRCIILGASANLPASNLQNIFVAGGSGNERIDNVFFGKGYTNATPTAYTINGTGGSGTNIAGADVIIAGGKGTGNAAAGSVLFQVASAGSSGTTLQSLTTIGTVNRLGLLLNVIPTYADEAAAVTGGLTTGQVYKTTTGEVRIKL